MQQRNSEISAGRIQSLKNEIWDVQITNGVITQLATKIEGKMFKVHMREDIYGFAWFWNDEKINLDRVLEGEGEENIFLGTTKDNVTLSLSYALNEVGQFIITARATNNNAVEVQVNKASVRLGIDTFLDSYPGYLDYFFTNLLRCEKTHLWGYFQTPHGHLLTIATDSPVASYSYDYEPGIYAHHIYTATLDLLQAGKLPERHLQGMDKLEAYETKEWHIYLKAVETPNAIEELKPMLAQTTELPMIDVDRYTMAKGERANITIYSGTDIVEAQLVSGEGESTGIEIMKEAVGVYKAVIEAKGNEGIYKFNIRNEAGYQGEAVLSIRREWSWYQKQAAKASFEIKQGAQLWTGEGTSCETWFGIDSGYISQIFWPDKFMMEYLNSRVEVVYPAVYNRTLNTSMDGVIPFGERITNSTKLADTLMTKYEATRDPKDLEAAVTILEYLINSRQREDGAYGGYGYADYISVLYQGKTIMDLMALEKEIIDNTDTAAAQRQLWQERYEKHSKSVTKAMDRLVMLDAHFETEGGQTYEDGAHSCSVTQLTQFALMFPEGSAEREKYVSAAIKVNEGHTSHQQLLVPDSRRVGGTLRYWETTEIQLYSNVMNSPHGWSAWAIYGQFNLYELTGDKKYLERGMNALGSNAQLMGFDGVLNWVFAQDPHREVELHIKDETKPYIIPRDDQYFSEYDQYRNYYEGKHIPYVIAEEYLPHTGYWFSGWTGQTPHEVFKAVYELALEKAYVYEKEDGTLEGFNCSVERIADSIVIQPYEDIICKVSVKLVASSHVVIAFYDGKKEQYIEGGELPQWVETKRNSPQFRVSVEPTPNGTLTTNITAGNVGQMVKVTPIPKEGFRMKQGSLGINGKKIGCYEFPLTPENISITAEFAQIRSQEINTINEVSTQTETGVYPVLPKQVTAIYEDGTEAPVEVKWDYIPLAGYSNQGQIHVEGNLVDTKIKAVCKITVKAKQSYVKQVYDTTAATVVGQAPIMPTQIKVTYSDGSLDETLQNIGGTDNRVNVTWDRILEAQYRSPGSFEVEGRVEGTQAKVKCTVVVAQEDILSAIEQTTVHTKVGRAPVMPTQVSTTNTRGEGTILPVTWEAFTTQRYSKPGSFVVEGSVAGSALKAYCIVIVSDYLEKQNLQSQAQTTLTNGVLTIEIDSTYPQVLVYRLEDGSQIMGGVQSKKNTININNTPYLLSDVKLERIHEQVAQYTITIQDVDLNGEGAAQATTITLVYEISLEETIVTKRLLSIQGDEANKAFNIALTQPLLVVNNQMNQAGIAVANTGVHQSEEKIGLLDEIDPFVINTAEYAIVWNAEVAATVYTPSSFVKEYTAKVSGTGKEKVGEIYEGQYHYRLKDGRKTERENGKGELKEKLYESKVYLTKDSNQNGKVDWKDAALWIRKQLPQMTQAVRAFFNGGNWHQTHGAFPGNGWAGHAESFQTFTVVYSTLQQILEVQRQVNNMTDGIGKQSYEYVGWNGMGHDYGWPNINEVAFNPALGTPQKMKTYKKLIEQYGGDLGFHLNMTDMTDNSESYLRGDIPSEFGNRKASTERLQYDKSIFGWDAWSINHYTDFDYGMNRQNDFVSQYFAPFMLYQDVMIDYPKDDFGPIEEQYAKMREVDNWKRLGTTIATEYYGAEKRQNGQFIFKNYVAPTTLANFMNAGQSVMQCTRNYIDMRIEDYIWGFMYSDDIRTGNVNVAGEGNQTAMGVTKATYLYSLPNGYVGSRELLDYKQEAHKQSTYWSDGIKWEADTKEGEAILTHGELTIARLRRQSGSITGEVFIPRLEEGKIFVYSVQGNENTWVLPETWQSQSELRAYELTPDGKVAIGKIPVTNGKIKLTTTPEVAIMLTLEPVDGVVTQVNLALNAQITASSNQYLGYDEVKRIRKGAKDVWIKQEQSPSGDWDHELKTLRREMKNEQGAIRYSISVIAAFTADGAQDTYWQPNIDKEQDPIIDMEDGEAWIAYQFVKPAKIKRVEIVELPEEKDAVTEFKLQVKEKGIWIDVYTGTRIPREAISLNTMITEEIRLVIIGANSNEPKVAEVKIYGETISIPKEF